MENFDSIFPDGTLADTFSGSNFSNVFLDNYEIIQTGTYKLLVRDNGGDETGEYNFTIQKTNAPINPVAINYGDSVTGQVDVTSDLDAFTFEATAGDRITLQLSDFGLLDSEFRLYLPNGQFLEAVSGSNFSNALLDNYELNETGTYKILVRDNGGDEIGDYTLTLNSGTNILPPTYHPIHLVQEETRFST